MQRSVSQAGGRLEADLPLNASAKTPPPSTPLRTWFAHDQKKWPAFCKGYCAKHAAQDREYYEAVILRDLFERVSAEGYDDH